MAAEGRGKIITIASMLSFSGGFRAAAYAASKGGVAQLTKALSTELAPRGVNVNAIAPGLRPHGAQPAHLDRSGALRAGAGAAARRDASARPPTWPGACVFLAAPASDYVHGIVLPVDGGWLAR